MFNHNFFFHQMMTQKNNFSVCVLQKPAPGHEGGGGGGGGLLLSENSTERNTRVCAGKTPVVMVVVGAPGIATLTVLSLQLMCDRSCWSSSDISFLGLQRTTSILLDFSPQKKVKSYVFVN